MDPITGNPSSKKIYYDIATYIGTQLTFAFAVNPFLTLHFSDCMKVWSRVYFYALFWTLGSLVFFASPGKAVLRKRLEKRQGRASQKLVRSISTESLTGGQPILGISKDPEGDINEAIEELKTELEKANVDDFVAKKDAFLAKKDELLAMKDGFLAKKEE